VLGTSVTLSTSLPLGTKVVTLKVTDPCGAFNEATVVLTVVDTTRPVILSGPAISPISADANCQALVPSVVSQIVATDNCTAAINLIVTQNPAAGTLVGLGSHTIIVTVTDASGNSTNGSLSFSVADTTAPVIQNLTATPNVLSPANKKPVAVTVSATVSDHCDGAPFTRITSITSNEATAPGDIQITGNLTANLVADRNASGNGRIYTITVQSTDASGNTSSGTVTVTVPKGKK